MITAKNYAAQIEHSLHSFIDVLFDSGKKLDAAYVSQQMQDIRQAQHFALPDTGNILGGEPKWLDTPLRLPYPLITIEYYNERFDFKASGENGDGSVKKICMVCKETDKGVNIVCYFYTREWGSSPFGCFIPFKKLSELNKDDFMITASLPESAAAYDMQSQNYKMLVFTIFSMCVVPMVQMIEALSCKNIIHGPLEKIDESLNKRRIASGKLPIYETRVLTLHMPEQIGKNTGTGGTHASPRQHLRRGHIRCLPQGNIWVNSCVVGDPTKGRIDKSYKILGGFNGNKN